MRFVLHNVYPLPHLLGESVPYTETYGAVIRRDVAGEILLLTTSDHTFNLNASRFTSPSQFAWVPDESIVRHVIAERETLFEALRKGMVHLFVQRREGCFYCGVVSLGAVLMPAGPTTTFRFHLESKLDRANWLQLGGYDKWWVTINEAEDFNILDEDALCALLHHVGSLPGFIAETTRYEGDNLTVSVSGEQAVVNYKTAAGELFSSFNDSFSGDPFEEVVFCFGENWREEFSKALVIPKSRAIDIFLSHIRCGHPEGLRPWSPPEPG